LLKERRGRMSKLSQVRKALQESSNVIIVGVLEKNSLPVLPGPYQEYGHTIDFFIAPNRFTDPYFEAYYTVEKVYGFLMRAFSPELTPTTVKINQELNYFPYQGVKFGEMWFDEDIGTMTFCEKIILRKEDSFLLESRPNKVYEYSKRIRRQIDIKFFLDIKTAGKVLEAENIHGITESEFERYQNPQKIHRSSVRKYS